MKVYKILLLLLFLSFSSLYAASSQEDVKVAIIGKLSNFITWNNTGNSDEFVIAVLADKEFKELLEAKYDGNSINTKKVVVKYIDSIDEINKPTILYIGDLPHMEQYRVIKHAKENSILSISQESGFAQRGGVIQLYFVAQKIKLKINHEASIESNLKISAALLSIATIVKGETE